MPFVAGYKQSEQHKKKVNMARKKRYGIHTCKYCEQLYEKYSPVQQTCGGEECQRKQVKEKYYSLAKEDPVRHKAKTLFACIRLGRGKNKIAEKLLEDALGKPCKYCGEIITLENASVDHKEPRISSKVYNRKTKKMVYTKEELQEIDNIKNLHIVCRGCNGLKNDFNDKEFRALLGFIKKHPSAGKKLVRRLAQSILLFSKK